MPVQVPSGMMAAEPVITEGARRETQDVPVAELTCSNHQADVESMAERPEEQVLGLWLEQPRG